MSPCSRSIPLSYFLPPLIKLIKYITKASLAFLIYLHVLYLKMAKIFLCSCRTRLLLIICILNILKIVLVHYCNIFYGIIEVDFVKLQIFCFLMFFKHTLFKKKKNKARYIFMMIYEYRISYRCYALANIFKSNRIKTL